MSFISFSYLVPLARTSRNMLNRGSDNGHHFLIFFLFQRKSFYPFIFEYNISCGFVIHGFYYTEVYSLCNSLLGFLILKKC